MPVSPRRAWVGLLVGVVLVGGAMAASQHDPTPGASGAPERPQASTLPSPAAPPSDLPTSRPRGTPTATLPAAQDRTYPAPGFEEQGAPLATPPVVPEGERRYAFTGTQLRPDGSSAPIAWSPCRPIHYVVDPSDAPGGFSEQVQAAMSEVAAATGLVLVHDGSSSEVSDIGRAAFQPQLYGDRWAPVLVGFADESTVPVLAGDTSGITNAIRARDRRTGALHLVTGTVYLDTELLAGLPPSRAPAYAPVLRHELGHLMGLAHVDDQSQLLHPRSTVETFQAGDLAGLAALGRGPCAPGL